MFGRSADYSPTSFDLTGSRHDNCPLLSLPKDRHGRRYQCPPPSQRTGEQLRAGKPGTIAPPYETDRTGRIADRHQAGPRPPPPKRGRYATERSSPTTPKPGHRIVFGLNAL